ncbi:unnamed protein product [Brassicogethes aeneus]|uniref:Mitochondrial cytochrome c oxidase subunit VIc/VIIs domain-containing protein n=1 Tax=Brassicogethes aeneus TaxID=1431903 RepID=A0A9P0FJL7_BRAAE|nr:unnamed protein product [Brassicogethes aeneus]
MSGAVSKANKPQMRGLLQSQIKRNLVFAIGLCTAAAVLQKVFYNDGRKRAYSEFYKTYDIEKAFNQIRNKGLFDSCEPDK